MIRLSSLDRFARSSLFSKLTISAILSNAVLMGVETHRPWAEAQPELFWWLHVLFQAFFVSEITLRLWSYRSEPRAFWTNGWNVFDFLVVSVSLIPAAGPLATIVRLARVLRVLRLVSVSPELRLIVGTMIRSIPSMGHVLLLLGLLFYVYGILGYYKFADIDPVRWGSLGACFMTLFQVLTLEGWSEIQAQVLPKAPWAWVYFVSFIVITVFVVVNLFIAVVTNNLQAVKAERKSENPSIPRP
jgi:voltage-gated sodium channel